MTRVRMFSWVTLLAALQICFSLTSSAQGKTNPNSGDEYLFIGTYGPADSNAIFVYDFNENTGTSRMVSAVSGIENPSYVTLSPDGRDLYSVSETHGGQGGQVYAYSFNRHDGQLTLLDHQLTGGDDPCNLTTDKTGKWLFAANYTSGSFTIFPLQKDGRIDKASRIIRDSGHGFNPVRQEGPHVHCVIVAPNNRDIFVSDLGLDKVYTYELDASTGHLTAGNPPFASVVPGRGPRIPDFSPNDKYLYLIQEMGGTITQFAYSAGKLESKATVSTIPQDYTGTFTGADIHFSPDGRFLYASNRDALNDIVWYQVDPKDGTLHWAGSTPSLGKTPRYFLITPNGRYLIVGHQNSDDIVIFLRDIKTGKLTDSGERIPVAHAVCLKIMGADH